MRSLAYARIREGEAGKIGKSLSDDCARRNAPKRIFGGNYHQLENREKPTKKNDKGRGIRSEGGGTASKYRNSV